MLGEELADAGGVPLNRDEAESQVVEDEIVDVISPQIADHRLENVAPFDPRLWLKLELEAHLDQMVAISAYLAHRCHLQIKRLRSSDDAVQCLGCIDVGMVQLHYFIIVFEHLVTLLL